MFHMTMEMYGKVNDLARLIKTGAEYKALESAQERCRQDPDAQRCQEALSHLSRRIENAQGDLSLLNELLREQEETLREQAELPCVRELQRAKLAVYDLVRGAAEALQGILLPDVQCACSGGCQGCGGCGTQG